MERSKISMIYIGDDSVVAHLHMHNYHKLGIKTFFSSSLSQTLSLCESNQIDVLVLNINSIKIDTVELTQQLSEQHKVKAPIIATGIPSSPQTAGIYLKYGAKIFIEQPLPMEIFLEKIMSSLGQHIRSSKRTHEKNIGHVFCYQKKALVECDIVDVSVKGLKVESPQKLKVSDLTTFKIHLTGKEKPIEVLGKLKSYQGKSSQKKSCFLYALVFSKILDEDKEYLENLIAEDMENEQALQFYE